jgi:hypothetical protein
MEVNQLLTQPEQSFAHAVHYSDPYFGSSVSPVQHVLLSWLCKSRYLAVFSLTYSGCQVPPGDLAQRRRKW